jgi:hypothetical protein
MLLLHEPFGIPGTRRLEKQSSAQLGKSAAAVPREGELTLVPRVQGITFNPPSRSFLWEESVHRVGIAVSAVWARSPNGTAADIAGYRHAGIAHGMGCFGLG